MKGRVSITSPRQRALRSIVEVCRAEQISEKQELDSMTLESSVVELTREMMREMATEEDRWYGKDSLLCAAIERTEAVICERLTEQRVDFKIGDTLQIAEKSLRQTGNELQQLSVRLSESKRERRVKPTVTDQGTTSQPVAFHQIGLEGSPTGLLARPANDNDLTLDFDALQEHLPCEISGDRFPVEVSCDDHIFVMDDDGSVFVYVDGLPPRDLEYVGGLLRKIVGVLYS